MEKGKFKSWNPREVALPPVPLRPGEMYLRDQRKAALLAAMNITDRDELCDVLEMLGLELKSTIRSVE